MAPTATPEKKEEGQLAPNRPEQGRGTNSGSPNIQSSNLPRRSAKRFVRGRPHLSRGLRKHIRREKARIRREFGNSEETKEKIGELYAKF